MRTNKRTVWFLTLLSLVAVISIYYIKEKTPMPFDGINIFKDSPESITMTENVGDSDKTTPVFAESTLFEEMRMAVRDERSKLKEQLTTKMYSSDYTSDEKNMAFDQMEKLTKLDSAEALMELQIKALGYPEAFVRTEDGMVKVTVLANEGHSLKLADEIAHYVKMNWAEAQVVTVDFTGSIE